MSHHMTALQSKKVIQSFPLKIQIHHCRDLGQPRVLRLQVSPQTRQGFLFYAEHAFQTPSMPI